MPRPVPRLLRRITLAMLAALVAAHALLPATPAAAQDDAPAAAERRIGAGATALARLPVREVTVFKDGHAFVLRQGRAPVDADGRVRLGDLPAPVLGTFWPFVAEKGPTLKAVTARRERAPGERPAVSLPEMFAANIGGEALIVETGEKSAPYRATVVSVPEPKKADPNDGVVLFDNPPAPQPPGYYSPVTPPERTPTLVLLRTENGIKALPFARIEQATFLGAGKTTLPDNADRPELDLHLSGAKPGGSAEVGAMYLQKGLRWVPSYKVTLDGKGTARIQLQATLVNELADLDAATVNLVVGVPSFAFAETADPVAAREVIARLSPYFAPSAATPNALANSLTGQFSNAFAAYRVAGVRDDGAGGGAAAANSGPDLTASERQEDLYVFTLQNVTLGRGQRMVIPVADYTLPYKDVFALELPPLPPLAIRNDNPYGGGQPVPAAEQEAARLLAAPKVMHKVRLTNNGPHPLTTAPALILLGDRVLAQGLMTYTARGARTDLTLTAAVDIVVKRSDRETVRTPNVEQVRGNSVTRVALTGAIRLTNLRDQPVEVEVDRYVLGNIVKADPTATIETRDGRGEDVFGHLSSPFPAHWDAARLNGLGHVSWKRTLAPRASATLAYDWSYLFTP